MDNIKTHWNGLEEFHNTSVYQEGLKKEFVEEIPLEDAVSEESLGMRANRRDFLKIFGFGLTAAALAACETPVKKAIPFLVKPDNVTPGVAAWYASTCAGCAAGCGVLVKSREGRPIKIEGNELSPISKGGVCSTGQATILNLYDAGRLKKSSISGAEAEWGKFHEAVVGALKTGGNVRVLTGSVNSPTTKAAIGSLLGLLPGSKHLAYDAVSYHAIRKSHLNNFGTAIIPDYDFSQAKIIVSIGADFLGSWISPVEFTKGWSAGRKVSDTSPTMSRHYQFEGAVSLAGSNADYRFPLDASNEGKLLLNIYNEVATMAGVPTVVVEKFDVAGGLVKSAAKDLWANKGNSLVVCGSNNVAMQEMTNALNFMLGNYGTTVKMSTSSDRYNANDEEMTALVEEMNSGQVSTLIMMGVNPVYDYFDSEKFKAAAAKVKNVVVLASKSDETTAIAQHVGAIHHYLESWDVTEPRKGVYSITQPLVRPLFDTRQAQDCFLTWAAIIGGTEGKNYYDFITEWWTSAIMPKQSAVSDGKTFWENTVRDGIFIAPATEAVAPQFGGNPLASAATMMSEKNAGGDFDVVLYSSVGLRDGRYANNPWLQELPDPITKVTWDNYAIVPIKYARENQIVDGDMLTITVNGKSLSLPALLLPGQARRTVSVALGYGRTAAGKVADGVGKNGYPLVTMKEGSFRYVATGATVAKAGGANYKLAKTQYFMGYEMEEGEGILSRKSVEKRIHTSIIKETTLEAYKKDNTAGNHNRPYIAEENSVMDLWNSHPKEGYHWAMVIDLNACTGCGSCIVSCNAENNVPVVGKKEVMTRRELHWMRLDRYYTGNPEAEDENLEMVHQPMMCQHCNQAPCESVCPVLAIAHSNEGMNQQVYNRCVGTRYCANNCPYKVRRFNWFSYYSNEKFRDTNGHMFVDNMIGRMVLNPDVNVRARGVMEKCSFCVQRIQDEKLKAKSSMTPLKDGQLKTACQQSCPADAIHFGNLNDPESTVHKLVMGPRAYHSLEEVKTLPNVVYLTKVRNKEAMPGTQTTPAPSHEESHS